MLRMPRAGLVIATVLAVAAVGVGSAPGWAPVRIHWGDTLWALAQRHHTTVAAIEAENHLRNGDIYAGQLLDLPGSRPTAPAPMPTMASYLVQPGDTLTAVARQFHSNLTVLARLNHLPSSMLIRIGQRLRVPVPVVAGQPVGIGARLFTTVVRDRVRLAAAAAPRQAQVRQLLRAEARRQGVDAALVLAVADDESGFQQGVVSPTDAVGVMQLEPATARWLSTVVGRPLNRFDVKDNIDGGVTLLRLLLKAAPLREAVAGYYQGLRSVRMHGYFTDTARYVATVLALRRLFH